MTDFWNEWAIENGAPQGWRWVRLGAVENSGEKCFTRIEGGVYGAVYKSGPRKGRPNLHKPTPGTERTFIVDHDEWMKWKDATCVKRGLCPRCEGDGRLSTGWSSTNGHSYRPCPAACPTSIGVSLHEPNKSEAA